MKANTTIKVTLELTEDEAWWLKKVMSKPLDTRSGQGRNKNEGYHNKEMRSIFLEALKSFK